MWKLILDDGGTLQARAVVCALGQLGRPALSDIAGRDGFAIGAVQALQAKRLAWLDVRPEVQDAFNSWVQSASRYRYRVRRFDLATYRVRSAMAGAGAA